MVLLIVYKTFESVDLMRKLTIKRPGKKNISEIIERYNRKKGSGLEIFYNYKRGKLVLGDYYNNFNRPGYRKLPPLVDGKHPSAIDQAFIENALDLAIAGQKKAFEAESKKQAEELAKFKARRRRYYRNKFGLK